MDIEQKLLTGNKQFVKSLNECKEKKDCCNNLIKGQHPYALVITCSDSRVDPDTIFSTFLGELFVIRTAGNVINDGELATVEYAIEHLNIKYILVLGHTHCGAIHASIHNEHGKYVDTILNRIRHSINSECDEIKASEINALSEAKYIQECFPKYDGKVSAGIYDIETNLVRIL